MPALSAKDTRKNQMQTQSTFINHLLLRAMMSIGRHRLRS